MYGLMPRRKPGKALLSIRKDVLKEPRERLGT